MSELTPQVGFSQRVRLEWLDKTANLILAGNDQLDIQDALQELLADKVSIGGRSVRGNREKTITILMKIWLNVPHGLEGLRDEGLNMLRDARANHRVAIHWGMALAVYPFWGEVAAQVGRLLRLQADLTAEQVQRRIKERYGDRQTVSRATRRVLRSFIDWDVLDDTERRGRYARGGQHSIADEAMIGWLAESVLRSRVGSTTARSLLDDPAIFPFRLAHLSSARLVSFSPRLEVLRLGLDDELIVLRPR